MRSPARLAVFLLLTLSAAGCARVQHRALVRPAYAATLEPESRFLKAHMRDGRLYVLHEWSVEPGGAGIQGTGDLLDANRRLLETRTFRLAADSIALLETNVVTTSAAVPVMVVLSAGSAFISLLCISDPKACFGSCPTFYASADAPRPAAEGFSSSIAPALEATDIDALWGARVAGAGYALWMRNEALETHVVRSVDLLVAPRPPGGRVLATPSGEFRAVWGIRAPERAWDDEGDCLPALLAFDGSERWSPADSTRLDARETIEIEFAAAPGESLGLVIAARQSLLTTFLFYQALAYLGRSAGACLAALQQGDASTLTRAREIGNRIGGIDVQRQDPNGAWLPVGSVSESGPIATDVRMLMLPPARAARERVRLELTRGAWRIDWIALAVVGPRVVPERLRPVAVTHDGVPDPAALGALLDSARTLITLPGDVYEISFALPSDVPDPEIFLESRGYYLEWMRPEWLAEENPVRAAVFFLDPTGTLRELAGEYKRSEPEMERLFWGSRYARR